jgi:MFS transporter, PPP family, 3-phenylpropionic acid transporter
MNLISGSGGLAIAYFLYFVTSGIYLPYFPPYLKYRDLNATDIGLVLSIGPVMRMVMPPLLGFMADKFKGPHFWALITAWIGAGGLLVVSLSGNPTWLLAGVVVYLFGISASIPLLDSAVFKQLENSSTRYGHIRLWGSAGFLVTSAGVGILFPSLPAAVIITSLLATHLLFAFFTSICRVEEVTPEPVRWREVLVLVRNKKILLLLLTIFINRVASGPFSGFFSIFVQEVGQDGRIVALTWALGVGLEIVVMLFIDRLIDRFGTGNILAIGVLLESIRWIGYAVSGTLLSLILLAPVHGLAFPMMYVPSVRGIKKVTPEHFRSVGQGLGAAASGFGQMIV